jgi:hypothetical protein
MAGVVEHRLGELGFADTHDLRNRWAGGGEKQQVFLVQVGLGH